MLDSGNRLSVWLTAGIVLMALGCGESEEPTLSKSSSTPHQESEKQTSERREAPPFPDNPSPVIQEENARRAEELLAAAENHLRQGEANAALSALNRAIRLNPRLETAYVRRADLLAKAGMTAQAIADVSRAIQLNPTQAQLFNTRGYLRLTHGEAEGSIEDFTRAIALDLEYAQPYNNRGLARLSLGDPETAIHDFDAALRIDPNYIDAHNNRGYTLSQLKRYDEALVSLTKAIELDAEYVNAWNNRGLVYKEMGRWNEALADFRRAVELDPTSQKYLLHRAEVYDALNQKTAAAADRERVVWLEDVARLNRMLIATPDDPTVWIERARLMIAGGELDEAAHNLQRAMEINKEIPELYQLRAQLAYAREDYQTAVDEATKALELKEQQPSYSVRGDAYFQLQNYEAALKDYRRARRLDSQVQQALEMRAEELETMGQVEQASSYREQASEIRRVSLMASEQSSGEKEKPLPFPETAVSAKPIGQTTQTKPSKSMSVDKKSQDSSEPDDSVETPK